MTRSTRVALLLLLVLPFLLQGATLPHTHAGGPHGLYNQEHDLTLLAIVGAVASSDVATPAVVLVLLFSTLVVAPRRRPATAPPNTADSRAPPVR
jgi:hypothetical protein